MTGRISGVLGRSLPGLRTLRSSKGAAELSVVVVAASLVLGVFFGNGLMRTSLDITDGLTWLKDEPSGEVIQVNPATGKPELRLDVGAPGDELDIAQYDGRLVVINRTTGELTSFDLATILASGQRQVSAGDATDILVHDDQVFLLDRSDGSLSSIDPVTTDVIGRVWVSTPGLVDAKVDEAGTVWALDPKGLVTGLRWTPTGASPSFEKTESRQVEGSGPGSVLVAHEKGVTLFGPDQGIVVQIGTGDDVVANAPRLSGTIEQPSDSPHDLVPASSPDTGTVVIVGDGKVREVNVAAIGCPKPGRPMVYRDLIYVPCLGSGKVIRLNREGGVGGPAINVPDGDVDLVVDDGYLLINVQGAPKGVKVMPDGSTQDFVRQDDTVPVQSISANPPAPQIPLPDIQDIADDNRDQGRGRNPEPPRNTDPPEDIIFNGPSTEGPGSRGDDPTSDGPGSGDPTSESPSASIDPPTPTGPTPTPTTPTPPPTTTPTTPPAALTAPTGVTASALADGSVQVTWAHSGTAATTFAISLSGGGTLATVAGANRQAVVTGVPAGTPVSFVVTARNATQSAASSPSNSVTTAARPGAPANVQATGRYTNNSKIERFTVTVTWGAAADNGSPISRYDITFSGGDGTLTRQTDGNGRTATATWSCNLLNDPSCSLVGGDFTATVTATNGYGAGPSASDSGNETPPPPALPAGGAGIVTGHDHQWDSDPREGFGHTDLALAPPADWAGFNGTCSYTYSGGRGGGGTNNIACNATSLTVNVHTGYIWEPNSGDVSHSIIFHASNASGSVDSARYGWTTRQQVLCEGCQVP